MADISKITPPGSQTTYNLKDATAREQANWNANNGVKNLLRVDKLYTSNSNGVTYTLNSDGSITANGTATSLSYITLGYNDSEIRADDLCNGNYVLSGCPSGGDFNTGYSLYAAKGNYIRVDTGSGVLLTSTSETDVKVVIRVASGVTINKTFKPMIRPAFIEDTTFEPYALPNTKITPELIELVDSGAKNLLEINLTSAGGGNATCTDNGDGSITITPAAGSGAFTVKLADNMDLPVGDYVLSINTPMGANNYITVRDSGGGQTAITGTTQTSVALNNKAITQIYIYLENPQSVTLRPMLCSKAAWDVSQKFVPYRPKYEETVEQVATNKNNILSCAKLYTVSKPSDGIVNTATFDWSQLVSGTYIITCMNVTGSLNRHGISIYAFYKFGDGSIGLWTDISDITTAKIASYVVTDDTLTLTYDVYGYHTVTIISLNILS